MSTTLLQTPLHSLHLELGAKMTPFAGYDMPVSYPAGILAEHRHCLSVTAHIGKSDPRDDATRAHRHVVDIAATLTWPYRNRMHPSS